MNIIVDIKNKNLTRFYHAAGLRDGKDIYVYTHVPHTLLPKKYSCLPKVPTLSAEHSTTKICRVFDF